MALLMALCMFPMIASADTHVINEDGTYSLSAYENGDRVTIGSGLTVTLLGDSSVTYTNFSISCGSGVTLTLSNVNINDRGYDYVCPLSFTGSGNTLSLADGTNNSCQGGKGYPGVLAGSGCELTITGNGALTTLGWGYENESHDTFGAAGIGGKSESNAGNITIMGGIIDATGGDYGAGIGSGCHMYGISGNCTVSIYGGTITARGGNSSAAIGGGNAGNATVNIYGGTITATGAGGGTGIGGGTLGNGTVNIYGGTVSAAAGDTAGAGIGGGTGGNGTVTITGGKVTAVSGDHYGAGIGGGFRGRGTVSISGGEVTATGGTYGAGIGGGQGSSTFMVSISGGTVKASGDGQAIGNGTSCDGTLYIGGGSVDADVPYSVYESPESTTQVYKTTVSGLPVSTDTGCAINGGIGFWCKTDESGSIYPWLPASDSAKAVIRIGDDYYKATGEISAAESNSITAEECLVITADSLPDGSVDDAYSQTLTAVGGNRSYTWSYTGTLPDGLAFSDGVLSGTPSEAGEYEFTLTVTDGNGLTGKESYTVTIYQALSVDLTALSVDGGTLSPGFDRDTVAYSVTPATDAFVDTIAITATAADMGTTLTIGGVSAASGEETTVGLDNGANLIPITLTSANGLSQKSYILSVNGTVSNADLQSLSLSPGGLSFDKDTTDYSCSVSKDITSIDITASPADSKAILLFNGAILEPGDTQSISLDVGENIISLMVVAQDATTKTYTIIVTRQAAIQITTELLPIGIVGAPYGKTLSAAGGSGSYSWTWEAAPGSTLPSGISLSPDGVLSTAPGEKLSQSAIGSYLVQVTVADASDAALSATQCFPLTIREGCGNGAYIIDTDGDDAYTGGYTDDGIPVLTVNSGYKGFTYFTVEIEAVTGHSGSETAIFVQIRNGQEINFSFVRNDFDTAGIVQAAFNVRPGDVVKVYILDSLSNTCSNPCIL